MLKLIVLLWLRGWPILNQALPNLFYSNINWVTFPLFKVPLLYFSDIIFHEVCNIAGGECERPANFQRSECTTERTDSELSETNQLLSAQTNLGSHNEFTKIFTVHITVYQVLWSLHRYSDMAKGCFVSNIHCKRWTNHNRPAHLTNQSRAGCRKGGV